MSDAFDMRPERECQIMSQMLRAAQTLPDDFWAVAVVQNLAEFLHRNERHLNDEDCSLIVGVGAYVSTFAKQEMMAEIQARMALGRAQGPRT